MSNEYFDKNGEKIEEGMTIRFIEDNSIEKVYACGEDDLGINASKESWLERHYGEDKEYYREFYPLSQFGSKGIEILK